jgi:hypothetical protein
LLAVPGLLYAQNNSHLACFKFKDSGVAKTTYTVDIGSAGHCIVKTPAKVVCVSTFKENVTPTPPGGGLDLNLNESLFFCYNAKCPKTPGPDGFATDQFGTHVFNPQIVTSNLLCAPASPSGAFLD